MGTKKSETITGTNGPDVIVAKGGADRIVTKGGDDLICAGGGGDDIEAGGGSDFIFGNNGNDKMNGGADTDYQFGGFGNDTYKGGADPDTAAFNFSPSPVTVDLVQGTATGEGADKLININGVFATDGHDTIVGDDNTNFVFGNGGNDDIDAGGDIDLITPGPGDDTVDGGNTEGNGFDLDIVYFTDAPAGVTVDLLSNIATGEGNDSITNFESVYGSNANDNITGDQDSNILFGGPGNDVMDGGGGPALDYAGYWFAEAPITASLMTNSATGEGSDTLTEFEGLLGTINHDDNLTGDNQDNYLDGDLGDDTLSGQGGDDLFLGGGGNDTMVGGGGNFDMADYFCVCNLNANLLTGTITGDGTDTVSEVEAVGAADGNDTLIGDGADNVFFGWGGNDVIQGMEGNDELDGGFGSNDLAGGAGNDQCVNATTTDGSCETTTGTVADHPLRLSTELVTNLRRNF